MTFPAPSLPAVSPAPATPRTALRGAVAADVVLAAALSAGTVAHLLALPPQLNRADESYFLLEAVRIRGGEVMYRDFFNFITPLASYALAALFWAFGTTMATARAAMAVVHATTAVTLFATSRHLAVGRGLALLPPLAYLALCQPVWPFASWHWVSTCLTALLCYALVAARPTAPPRRAIVPGVLAGLLLGVQQQKGVVLAGGAAAVLLAGQLVAWRPTDAVPWRPLLQRLAWFTAGVTAIIAPVLGVFAFLAGPTPLYDGLVRFPLESYRPNVRAGWGAAGPITRQLSGGLAPVLLRLSPLCLLPVAAELAGLLVRGRAPERVHQLGALLIVAAGAATSIAYFPDLIHIAFIAGVFWVAAARGLEWMLGALPGGALARGARALLVAGCAAALLVRMEAFATARVQDYPVRHDTAFGQIAFRSAIEPQLIDQVRALADAGEITELFCYPHTASPYLTTGVPNATPYQFLLAGISPPAHIANAIAILERKQLPYVIASPFLARRHDPLIEYIRTHYEMLPPPRGDAQIPPFALYRRLQRQPSAAGG